MTDVRLDDDRLAAVLASIGEHLVVDGSAGAAAPRAPRRRWRPLLVAAVAIAVVAGAVVAIAPARRVVSGWLRIGRIELDVDRRTDSTGLPALTAAAQRIDPAAADELLDQPMPDVDGSALGAPQSDWWTIPEGGVLVGWPDGETSLWVSTNAGGEELVDKIVVAEADVTELAADGVVIWADGDLTWRLEGTAELDTLIAAARQLADT
jgi:hypothetical protein